MASMFVIVLNDELIHIPVRGHQTVKMTRTGISDTPQAESSRRASAINCLARTRWVQVNPYEVTIQQKAQD